MAILVDEEQGIFTLETKNTTYQMKADSYGFLLHLYYGRKARGIMDYYLNYMDRGFSGNPYDAGNNREYSLDILPQEFPVWGNGDFRSPVMAVRRADGAFGCDMRYQGYRLIPGKYSLPGLPAVYAGEEEAQTLEILLEDKEAGIQAALLYGVLPELDMITRSVRVRNTGQDKYYLEKIQSACLDFAGGEYDLLTFYGRHLLERNLQRVAAAHGRQCIGSTRGASSHQYNPMMILADKDAAEEYGSCYGMMLVFSGGFLGEAEKDQFGQTRIQLGLQEEQFSYPLNPGESFYAPEVMMTYSSRGLGHLSRNFHKCIRKHICRGKYRDMAGPVLVNSWEAAYFNFDGGAVCRLAEEAAGLGMEMVVMDDGWFGKRDDDNSGLGDWKVNEAKLGCSLGELVEKINGLGMKFGIWVEPEMVSEDSSLYREHPDWAFSLPGKKPIRDRNQLVLDFSRAEVVDAIYEQICAVLEQGNIEYLKWDMNRSLSDVYTYGKKEQGKVLYDYVLGVYDFLERLHQRYPDLLIEGCCGGGGRFDAGMLYYAPQIWCSDNTDAVDRTRIQYGTSFGYPVSVMGAHVSAVPNHQTGRVTPLKTRGIVASSGAFGYELDLERLTENEKMEVKEQIKDFHKYEAVIRQGSYYRLSNPCTDPVAAWEFISEDGETVLVNVVILEMHGGMPALYIRVRGLEEGCVYEEAESGRRYPAEALMDAGLPFPAGLGDYQAFRRILRKI